MAVSAQGIGVEPARAGGADRTAPGERVDVSDEQTARELAQLDADVLAVLAVVEPDDVTDRPDQDPQSSAT